MAPLKLEFTFLSLALDKASPSLRVDGPMRLNVVGLPPLPVSDMAVVRHASRLRTTAIAARSAEAITSRHGKIGRERPVTRRARRAGKTSAALRRVFEPFTQRALPCRSTINFPLRRAPSQHSFGCGHRPRQGRQKVSVEI